MTTKTKSSSVSLTSKSTELASHQINLKQPVQSNFKPQSKNYN